MLPVGSGVEQNVPRDLLDAPVHDGFQFLIIRLTLFEGQIVDEQNEPEGRAAAEELIHLLDRQNIVFMDLDEPQIRIFWNTVSSALMSEDLPVPRSPQSRTLFAFLAFRNCRVFLTTCCFMASIPMRSSGSI